KMSNKLSFWDGQPVTAPVYPQMGDIQQVNPNFSGCGSRPWPWQAAMHQQYQRATGFSGESGAGAGPGAGAGAGAVTAFPQRAMQAQGMGLGMGMGDFRQMSCSQMPASSFFVQHNGQYEPCIGDAEAFCAYNGVDESRPSARHGGANGDFY
ncbi:hypothetical protein KR054_007744, partial [Drosophila jambulina]